MAFSIIFFSFRNDYHNCVIATSVDQTKMIEISESARIKSNRWWKEMEKKMVPNIKPDYPFALLGEEGMRITKLLLFMFEVSQYSQ